MSKVRGIGMAVGSAAAAAGVAKELQRARRTGDRLLLLNAVASAAVVLTGFGLAVRSLRGRDDRR
jgi:hypothetical protein